ncbi:AraC-type DNA-binding protein [Rhodococcus triatomae]|uniref:AraC-type DNA-binding protein n=1 Tax=Rhodococcus triatomae TaxID=300028 RepID=A0A1G8HM82_9NOCA|nr:AraC-type DNA-binding protein [Rhodococcus triatomae]
MFPGAVVWENAAAVDGDVLPDGCMDLIWMNDEVVVAGPDTRPFRATGVVGRPIVGMRFAPGALPVLLGVHAEEIANHRVALADVLSGRAGRELRGRILDSGAPARTLEAFAAELRAGIEPDPRVAVMAAAAARGAAVGDVADAVGVGERQLRRLARRNFGYGPRMLARILRLQAALRISAGGVPAAEVAAAAGYADQAHLIRESRELAGRTFGALVSG